MSLRNRVRLTMIALIALWFLTHAWFVGVRNFLEGWELGTLLLAVAIGSVLSKKIIRGPLSRLKAALAREDVQTAMKEHKLLVDFWRAHNSETIKAYGIYILILEEQYRDALEQLRALDMKRIGKNGAPVITTQIAWCMAQLGEPEKARELAQSVLPQLPGMDHDYSCHAHLVLGVCEFLLGRPAAAVPYLEEACSSSVASRNAAAAYYLGESRSALHNAPGARLAYQQAHQVLPHGIFGVRALERLTGLSARNRA
jgi:tetratricopeptide (TPR) repeat protein